MNRRPWWAAFLAAIPLASGAGEARLAAGGWLYDVSGEVQTRGERIDFERDVDVEVRSRAFVDARWDTDSAWVPDFAGSWLHIDAGGRRTVTTQAPGPLPVPPTTTVTLADADLQDAELTLRYPWRGEKAVAWGGVTVKWLSGDVTTRIQEETQETREPVRQTLPMLHGALALPLGERFAVHGAIDWIAAGDDRALGWRVGADCTLFGPVGVTAAWQRRQYRVNAGDDRLDATLDGALLQVFARWGS